MSNEIAGLPLAKFEEPVRHALQFYQKRAHRKTAFDFDTAASLGRTPEDTTSALSRSRVEFAGKAIAELRVVAFAPGDGTGNEDDFKLFDLYTGVLPRQSKIVPRRKNNIRQEACLPLASFHANQPDAEPVLLASSLALLSVKESLLNSDTITRVGFLGSKPPQYQLQMYGIRTDHSSANYTVADIIRYNGKDEELVRTGDPNAVYNPYPEYVQVCGFIALENNASDEHEELLRAMGTYRLFIDDELHSTPYSHYC